jgi:hypothetical protein
MEQWSAKSVGIAFHFSSLVTAKPRRTCSPGGVLLTQALMVIVTRRRPRIGKSNQSKEHDFSRDKGRCAKCGMRLRVWEDTRVFCPGKPYSIHASRSLVRTC